MPLNDFPFPRAAPRLAPIAPEEPTAEFTFIVNGRTVQFIDQSTDPDGVIVRHHWDFGELPTAEFSHVVTGRSVQFTDLSTDVPPGVIVRHHWDFGENTPVPAFDYRATGLSVQFTDESTDPLGSPIVAWLWQFGDATSSTVQHPLHAYAAPGSYQVTLTVTNAAGLTSTLTGQLSLVVAGAGRPFGPYGVLDGSNNKKSGTQHFNLTTQVVTPGNIIAFLAACRRQNIKVMLQMTGGNHSQFKTASGSTWVFDRAKWNARMEAFASDPNIMLELELAVRDGIVIGNSIMDEPYNTQKSSPEKITDNSWGPSGWMKKVGAVGEDYRTNLAVDDMARYAKELFPFMPCGVVHNYYLFKPEIYYVHMDFLMQQYRYQTTSGQIQPYIDAALQWCADSGLMKNIFSMNILDGGIQAVRQCDNTKPDHWVCTIPETQGRGTYCPNCRMTAAQIESFGTALVAAASTAGLLMWRYDEETMASGQFVSANQAAFAAIRAVADVQPAVSLFRGS